MNYIFDSFIRSLLKEFEAFFDFLMMHQFNLVFRTEESITGVFFAEITQTIYMVGLALLVLAFLKKGFGIYVMWQDGDPDIEPSAYLLNFVKAIVTATCFPFLFGMFVDICEEVTSMLLEKISEHSSSYANVVGALTTGLTNTLPLFVFIVAYIILFFSFLMRGIELLALKVGVPIACVGLLDNDRGVFKAYFMQFVKVFVTTMLQIILAKIGTSIMFSPQTDDIWGRFLGIACIIVAVKTPKLVAEFLLPIGGGGGKIQSLVYIASMSRGFFR
ncbi:MAG: DUF6102 family protein [Oscillospiraceae bacterium]|nr:DUF6102 family protein [Oscillospiraceae bacterium]